MAKKYKVSEFSQLMGVSVKTLKHYERFNILVPEKDEDTNYRYYTFRHGERILRSKGFTSLGFTLKEASRFMNDNGNEEIIEALTRRETELAGEIELLQLKHKRIKELKRQCILFRDKPNTWMLATRKACYFIKHVHNAAFIEDEKMKCRVESLIDCEPHTMKLYYVPKDSIGKKSLEFYMGIGINAETGERLNLDVSEPMLYFREEKCFLYIYSAYKSEVPSEEIIAKILDIMRKEGYQPTGDIIVEGGIDQYPNARRIYQLLIWIPINE